MGIGRSGAAGTLEDLSFIQNEAKTALPEEQPGYLVSYLGMLGKPRCANAARAAPGRVALCPPLFAPSRCSFWSGRHWAAPFCSPFDAVLAASSPGCGAQSCREISSCWHCSTNGRAEPCSARANSRIPLGDHLWESPSFSRSPALSRSCSDGRKAQLCR